MLDMFCPPAVSSAHSGPRWRSRRHAPPSRLERAMTTDQAERPRSYSLREAAGILGVSVTAVRRRVAAGQIQAERVERPQGSSWRVYLDAHAPVDAPRVRVAERDTLKAPREPVPAPGTAELV